jgi:hypothetical protein
MEVGSALVTALEQTWAAIRAQQPDVPPAVLITGSGFHGKRELKLGHFAASRWAAGGRGSALAEVFIGGEGLARGGRRVLGTLLHEAAHGLAHVREIAEVSRQGRYHNARFRALAEELGLTVEHHPRRGWSTTTLPTWTARRYRDPLAELDVALRVHRAPEQPSAGSASGGVSLACECGCGRLIRISPSTLRGRTDRVRRVR